MAAVEQQKIEIELEIQKASATAVVQEITKSISDFVKNIGEMGTASTGTDSGITRTAKGVQQLGEKSKDTSKSLGQLATFLAPLVGPIGTIALIGSGLAAVASTLDDFATKKLNFKNLAIDIGLTTGQMSIMGRTFERMGMSADESKSRIQEIGAQLKELQTYGERTDLFRNLSFRGDGAFARALLAAVKADKFYEAFQMINAEYNRLHTVEGPAAAANFLSNVEGMTESIAKFYDERSKGVRESVHTNTAALREFHQRMEEIGNTVSNVWSRLKYEVMKFALEYGRLFEPEKYDPATGAKLGGIIGKGFNLFDPKPMGPGRVPTEPNASKSLGGIRRRNKIGQDSEEKDKKESNSTLEKIRDSIKNLFGGSAKQHGGSVEAGKNYLIGEAGPELFQGGGNTQVVGMDGAGIYQPDTSGSITPSSRIEDRRGETDGPPAWWMQYQHFRHNNPVAKFLYGEDYQLNDLRLPLAKSGLGDPLNDPAEIWTSDNYNQFLRGETPGSATGRIRSLKASPSERQQLDLMLHAEEGGAPNLNAEITFKNIPPGVTTKADGDGFDNFRVNKSKALD